eukprot:Rmarinus@m.25430
MSTCWIKKCPVQWCSYSSTQGPRLIEHFSTRHGLQASQIIVKCRYCFFDKRASEWNSFKRHVNRHAAEDRACTFVLPSTGPCESSVGPQHQADATLEPAVDMGDDDDACAADDEGEGEGVCADEDEGEGACADEDPDTCAGDDEGGLSSLLSDCLFHEHTMRRLETDCVQEYLTFSQKVTNRNVSGLTMDYIFRVLSKRVFPALEKCLLAKLVQGLSRDSRLEDIVDELPDIVSFVYNGILSDLKTDECVSKKLLKKASTKYYREKSLDPLAIPNEICLRDVDGDKVCAYGKSVIDMISLLWRGRSFQTSFVQGMRELKRRSSEAVPDVLSDMWDTGYVRSLVATHLHRPVPPEHSDKEVLCCPIMFYYDDVDLGNNARKTSQGKVTANCYGVLVGLPSWIRTRVDAMLPLSFAQASLLKGISDEDSTAMRATSLSLFFNDIRSLKSDKVTLELENGEVILLRGFLLEFSADQPAAHSLLGLNVSIGTAMRGCRHCLWGKNERERDENHLKAMNASGIIEELASDPIRESDEIYEIGRQLLLSTDAVLQKNTGVKRMPVFPQDLGFDIVKGTPQDPMHNLMEGVLTRGARRVVVHAIAATRAGGRMQDNTRVEDGVALFRRTHMKGWSNAAFVPSGIRMKPNEGDTMQLGATHTWHTSIALPFVLRALGVSSSSPVVKSFLLGLRMTNVFLLRYSSEPQRIYLKQIITLHDAELAKIPGFKYYPKNHYSSKHGIEALELFASNRLTSCAKFEGRHLKTKMDAITCANWNKPSRRAATVLLRRLLVSTFSDGTDGNDDSVFSSMNTVKRPRIRQVLSRHVVRGAVQLSSTRMGTHLPAEKALLRLRFLTSAQGCVIRGLPLSPAARQRGESMGSVMRVRGSRLGNIRYVVVEDVVVSEDYYDMNDEATFEKTFVYGPVWKLEDDPFDLEMCANRVYDTGVCEAFSVSEIDTTEAAFIWWPLTEDETKSYYLVDRCFDPCLLGDGFEF